MNTKSYLKIKLALLITLLIAIIGIFGSWMLSDVFFSDSSNADIINDSKIYTFDNISEINIDTFDLDIIVKEVSSDKTTITVTGERLAQTSDDVFQSDSTLYFAQDNERTFPFFWGADVVNRRGLVTIEIPVGTVLDCELYTVDGEITVDTETIGDLTVNSVSSDIKVYSTGDELNVDTVNSSIYSYSVFNKIEINGVDGDSYLVANQDTRDISIDNVNADTIIEFDGVISYEIDAVSLGGDTISAYDITPSADGQLEIEINTLSGDLILEDWTDN